MHRTGSSDRYCVGRNIVICILLLIFSTYDPRLAAVDLLYFTATVNTNHILLEWETAQEIDNLGYNIQRSIYSDSSFESIGDFIPTNDDPFAGGYYSYSDYEVVVGQMYYYRLESVDASGVSEFSDVVSAMIHAPTPTITSTHKNTRTPTLTPYYTNSPSPSPSATRTPSSTPTLFDSNLTKTATPTYTPTTTLGPLMIENQVFPMYTLTNTMDNLALIPSVVPTIINSESSPVTGRISLLVFIIVLLWVLLAAFLVLYLKRIKR